MVLLERQHRGLKKPPHSGPARGSASGRRGGSGGSIRGWRRKRSLHAAARHPRHWRSGTAPGKNRSTPSSRSLFPAAPGRVPGPAGGLPALRRRSERARPRGSGSRNRISIPVCRAKAAEDARSMPAGDGQGQVVEFQQGQLQKRRCRSPAGSPGPRKNRRRGRRSAGASRREKTGRRRHLRGTTGPAAGWTGRRTGRGETALSSTRPGPQSMAYSSPPRPRPFLENDLQAAAAVAHAEMVEEEVVFLEHLQGKADAADIQGTVAEAHAPGRREQESEFVFHSARKPALPPREDATAAGRQRDCRIKSPALTRTAGRLEKRISAPTN